MSEQLALFELNDHPWAQHMRALLGKEVVVTLQREPEQVTAKGVLLWFDDFGEVCLRSDDGATKWAWPNMETVLADD